MRAEQGSEGSGLSHNAFGFGKLSAAVGAVIVPLLETTVSGAKEPLGGNRT